MGKFDFSQKWRLLLVGAIAFVADKYKGKFDDGWDAYRDRVFARQKAVIPNPVLILQ